ncbi:ABC transporter ATP-binding protein [Defluviitalea phaphyphila]|uniref:ABC transporter ATP-binding protein n=1 Tax=Defluviitalea phaphyphila TaxID=1473580 RepID=UPI0007308927|nr:ABC transporter ATP-binding protein [Defluviitalea phaphyphila]
MIEVLNLSKSYGPIDAVKDISFSLKKGEILGFLGPNGAGKSTTMNMLCGLLVPDKGKIKINDIDLLEYPKKAKRHIGYLPEIPPLYPEMTVIEYLLFCCELKKISKNKQDEVIRVMKLSGTYDVKNRLIKNLSKGYKQRLGIASALIGDPDVLIFDEPTVGLDPNQIREIRNMIKSLSKNHSIILSSHILPEVNALCDRIIIMNKGEISAIDTPKNLSLSLQNVSQLLVEIEGPKEDVLYTLSSIKGVLSVEIVETINDKLYTYKIEGKKDIDVRRPIFYALADAKMPILKMEVKNMSLEDVFLKITLNENNKGGHTFVDNM